MAETKKPRRAGLFDIRVIIATLIGAYGVIVLVAGFFTSDRELAAADGLNVNIWAGAGMIVVSIAFVAWARIRPIVVPPEPEDGE